MKKALLMLLILVACTVALSACGGEATPMTEGTTTTTTATTEGKGTGEVEDGTLLICG